MYLNVETKVLIKLAFEIFSFVCILVRYKKKWKGCFPSLQMMYIKRVVNYNQNTPFFHVVYTSFVDIFQLTWHAVLLITSSHTSNTTIYHPIFYLDTNLVLACKPESRFSTDFSQRRSLFERWNKGPDKIGFRILFFCVYISQVQK